MLTRLYVRIFMLRHTGWDDYVMISAMVLVSSPLFTVLRCTRCWSKQKLCLTRTARIALAIYAAWSRKQHSCSLTQRKLTTLTIHYSVLSAKSSSSQKSTMEPDDTSNTSTQITSRQATN